jgi:hypothetical protein
VEELELVWVCCGWCNDLLLSWCGCWRKHGVTVLTSATTSRQKLISTPPTAHSNQFQLFHDCGR